MDELRQQRQLVATQINRLLASRRKVEPQVLVPQISVNMRPEAASQFNLTPGALMRSVTTLVNGMQVGEIYKDQNIFWRDRAAGKRLCIAICGHL